MKYTELQNSKELLKKLKNSNYKSITIKHPVVGNIIFKKLGVSYLFIDGLNDDDDDVELLIEGISNKGHVYFKSSDYNNIKISVEF